MELKRPRTVAAALAGLGLAVTLTGCGGGSIQNATSEGDTKCDDDLNVAINPWVGYEADAHVLGYVAENRLGCKVNYKDLDEQASWKGLSFSSARSSVSGGASFHCSAVLAVIAMT